jgi:hypothetical protein
MLDDRDFNLNLAIESARYRSSGLFQRIE